MVARDGMAARPKRRIPSGQERARLAVAAVEVGSGSWRLCDYPPMSVTLRDVAAHVGVSPRTVSNVVNGYRYVSPDMRTKVQAAVDELDYRPNLLARSLREGKTATIAVLVPDLSVPYFAELAHQLVEHARTLGLTVLIDETAGTAHRETELLDVLTRTGRVDGIILNALGLGGPALARLTARLPTVLLGERTAPSALDHVGFDNSAAARQVVDHLIGQGRHQIAVIAGATSPAFATSHLRLRGYRAALRGAGLPYRADLMVRTSRWHRSEGAAAMADLLTRPDPPDAVIAFNDALALGALRTLYTHGAAVPAAVSVAGFDNIDDAAYSTPTLTTIGPDKADIARCCLGMLAERIAGHDGPPRDVHVPVDLHIRESSLAALIRRPG